MIPFWWGLMGKQLSQKARSNCLFRLSQRLWGWILLWWMHISPTLLSWQDFGFMPWGYFFHFALEGEVSFRGPV